MSIPRIYPDGTTTPDTNGLGRLSDATRLEITEKINGSYELEMDYPVDGINFQLIAKNRLIYTDKQFFQIYETSREIGGIVTVYAEHISYRLSHLPVVPFTASGTPTQLWEQIKCHAVSTIPFTFKSDIQTVGSLNIDKPRSVKDILMASDNSFLSVFKGEFNWDNWNINFNKNCGVATSYVVRYGNNLTDVKQEENLQEVDTAIFPYATSKQDKETTTIYLPEKIIQTKNANLFSYSRILPVDFSQKFDSKETPTVEALRQLGNAYIKDNNIGEPKISIDVSFVDLSQTLEYKGTLGAVDLHLGDRLTVIYQDLGIHATAEITQTVKEPLQDRFKTLHLGDFQGSLTNSIIHNDAKNQQNLNDLNNRIDDVEQGAKDDLEKEKEETKRKLTEVDTKASKQIQAAQKTVREIEEKTGKEIDDAKKQISDFVSRNSSGSPLQFYDQNGNIVQGIPPVSTIKSRDGNFELNSSGFNWGGRLLGGNGQLYADGIYGETITGYDINGAHIKGGTLEGVTFDATQSGYFRVAGGSSATVMSTNGFSVNQSGFSDGYINLTGAGNWSPQGFYTPGKVTCSSAHIGGQDLTGADIAKLHRLKG